MTPNLPFSCRNQPITILWRKLVESAEREEQMPSNLFEFLSELLSGKGSAATSFGAIDASLENPSDDVVIGNPNARGMPEDIAAFIADLPPEIEALEPEMGGIPEDAGMPEDIATFIAHLPPEIEAPEPEMGGMPEDAGMPEDIAAFIADLPPEIGPLESEMGGMPAEIVEFIAMLPPEPNVPEPEMDGKPEIDAVVEVASQVFDGATGLPMVAVCRLSERALVDDEEDMEIEMGIL